MSRWFEERGEYADVVISSRVRLARNLSEFPFSTILTQEQAVKLCRMVEEKLAGMPDEDGELLYGRLSAMSELGRNSLVERHILSPMMAEKTQEAGLYLSQNESRSIMVNEEDHFRIQALAGGMNMEYALKMANQMDDYLTEHLDIAYDSKYGYLTACPTNVGTGLRASYMMFLPGLASGGKMEQLTQEAAKCKIAIRGMYGEGTRAASGIFQISNQRTLGLTEEEIIRNLNSVALQIIEQERAYRKYVMIHRFDHLEDQIFRAYGILRYGKDFSAKEAMALLSELKLGEAMGLIAFEDQVSLFKLMMDIQPANLQCSLGRSVGSAKRDRIRAEYLNRSMPKLKEAPSKENGGSRE